MYIWCIYIPACKINICILWCVQKYSIYIQGDLYLLYVSHLLSSALKVLWSSLKGTEHTKAGRWNRRWALITTADVQHADNPIIQTTELTEAQTRNSERNQTHTEHLRDKTDDLTQTERRTDTYINRWLISTGGTNQDRANLWQLHAAGHL